MDQWNAEYFLKESLGEYSDDFSCYFVCKDEKICQFLPAECKQIDQPENLIGASPVHRDRVKVWSRQPIKMIPHFLLFRSSGSMFDYSLNREKSPPVEIEAKFDGKMQCFLYDKGEKRVVARKCGSDKLYQWNFDQKNPIEMGIKDKEPKRPGCFSGCTSSPDGRTMFIYGGGRNVDNSFVFRDEKLSYPSVKYRR